MKVGLGFDAHAFDESRPLILGGVHVPDAPGLAGHSDADVLCHAVADAILGAAGLGDLGDLFPGDERWKDGRSLDMVRDAVRGAAERGWSVDSVDSTIVAQRPSLAPHRPAMRTHLAQALEVDEASVSVKATTTDGMGFTGRGEGIAALAVVLLRPHP